MPRSPRQYDDLPPTVIVNMKTSGASEGARQHGAGPLDEEACADEDEDEDD